MIRIFATLLLLTSALFGYSQNQTYIADLNYYGDVINNAFFPEHRERAHESFKEIFDMWIQQEDFEVAGLDSLKFVSVKSPSDKSFTIVTWQVKKPENNDYFGYIFKAGQVYTLMDKSDFHSDLEYTLLNPDEWYGAVYYGLNTFVTEGKTYYVLFGYNGDGRYENQKLAEVLTFEDGQPVFGAEIFKKVQENKRDDVKSRLLLKYSDDANVSINFNPGLDMIVLDHLIPRMGTRPGQGPTFLPDGSYVGYAWDAENGFFNYIDKIYNQVSDTPPMPKPILGEQEKSKDIFGRDR